MAIECSRCGGNHMRSECPTDGPVSGARNEAGEFSMVTEEMIERAARAVGYRDYMRGLHNAPERAEDWSRQHYHMYRGIAEIALRAALENLRPADAYAALAHDDD